MYLLDKEKQSKANIIVSHFYKHKNVLIDFYSRAISLKNFVNYSNIFVFIVALNLCIDDLRTHVFIHPSWVDKPFCLPTHTPLYKYRVANDVPPRSITGRRDVGIF